MPRCESVGSFRDLQKELFGRKETNIPILVVPAGTCGRASGVNELIKRAKRDILARNLAGKIHLRITGCHGFCEMEPSVLIEPYGTFYPKVKPEQMEQIIDAAVNGKVLVNLLFVDSGSGTTREKQDDIPFFKKQVRNILEQNAKVDPLRINTYIGCGGYSALSKVLEIGDPGWIVEEIISSGLRGRGGAGFPTGLKWEMLANENHGRDKYLVCNADEGDPGAYMDRSILEGNPHSIIEGMIIGAFATGASDGLIYVRNEYPLAIKHLLVALGQARQLGLLGKNILGTRFSFDINLVQGAGAFVCGEETALIKSIMGRMGEPAQRPPFPVQRGIDGRPTAINNVETYANIPIIVNRGALEFNKIGTKGNSGTKIFSLVGKVKYTGLVEVPMGTPIREIVIGIGDGPVGNLSIKAVQTGGPSGGCIPAEMFHLPIDYGSLAEAGSIMGSGGMIVMDESTCIVDVARYYTNFIKDESCGKCFACRKGTQRMFELLDDISKGRGTVEHLDLLEELAVVVKDVSMCGLGQTSSNPVLSTLRYFRKEYLEHIENKRCPAGVCKELITYSINQDCTGCTLCVRVCSKQAITGKKGKRHVIDSEKCCKCGICYSLCNFGAVEVN